MLIAALLLQATPTLPPPPFPTPSPQAIALGTQLAETGTLASLLPMMAAKETDEMVAQHPELSTDEQAELRRTAEATFAASRTRLMAAQGRVWAERLSLADLRVLAARNGDAVSGRYRAALVPVIATSMGAIGGVDFKGDTMKAFCAKTRKACGKQLERSQ